ncbi:hypothetical protein OG715_00005 [Kitasatospora purpeofusca]|uniref:hypothetical protein n=1 Tax=Kitasatospora purpeofusca TaxID=67352 RepID=UPI002E162F09|nr:hypothetical protein OG715_00005 [Kitasatospora purpeofusca]
MPRVLAALRRGPGAAALLRPGRRPGRPSGRPAAPGSTALAAVPVLLLRPGVGVVVLGGRQAAVEAALEGVREGR